MDKILYSGFEKVASIIEGVENYDYILGERVNRLDYINIADDIGLVSKENSIRFLEKSLNRKISVKKIDIKEASFLGYGSTYNNKRELIFLESRVRKYGLDCSIFNLSLCDEERKVSSNLEMKQKIMSSFEAFISERLKIRKSLLYQSINYAVSLLAAEEVLKKIKFKYFVVANDHSPIPVAYAKISQLLGKETIYLQHAEVTEIFPPLDFNYSFLRNRASLEIYKKKEIRGKVLYANRSDENINESDLIKIRGEIISSNVVDVVIYPSSIFNKCFFKNINTILNNNINIREVSIKLHPSCKDIAFFEEEKVNILNDFPKKPHVAICGNSSVAVDLIEAGNLVFNFFELDSITYDYYNFLKNGLTKKITLEECSRDFWRSKDIPNFTKNLSDYLPSILNQKNTLEIFKEKEVIYRIFCDKPSERIETLYFERDIFLFQNTFIFLARKKEKIPYDDFFIIKNLNKFFDARDYRLSSLYKKSDLNKCGSIIDFWINTKVMEWNGKIPSLFQLDQLFRFLVLKEHKRKVRAWLEQKYFDICIRFFSPEEVLRFFKFVKYFNLYKVGINKKIAFLNYAKSNNSYLSSLSKIYNVSNDSGLSRLDRLKIFVQSGSDVFHNIKLNDFLSVEKEFIESHKSIAAEYKNLVISSYDLLGDRACLIDVKRNIDQESSFIQLIINKLKSKSGFSFIRLSDGEGFIFQPYSNFFSHEDSLNRQRHWWGKEINKQVIKELQFDLQSAVKNADVLGIPSIYRFVRDHSDKTYSLIQSLQGRGLISVLVGLKYVDSLNKIYTDDKANIAIFNKIENIRKVSFFAEKIVIVNSGSSESVKNAFSQHFEYLHIQVPTHHKTSLNSKYHSDDRLLPYVYKEISNSLREVCAPGVLVLVGAGVAGKVFIDIAKERGAVALDLGSAMDEFLNGSIHSLF